VRVRPRSSSRFQVEAAAIAPLEAPEWVAISRAVDAIFQTGSEEPNFSRVLDLLLDELQSEAGAFGYIDEFQELALPFVRGFDGQEPREKSLLALPPEEWEGAWGAALSELSLKTANQPSPAEHVVLPARRALAAPVRFGPQLLGLLYAANKPSDYDAVDEARIALIAQRVAPVMSSWLAHRRFRRELSDAEEMAAAAAEGERFFMMSRDLMTIADAQIRRANPAFGNLLGWEDHELRNKSIADLTHPADRALLDREFTLMRTEPNREHTPISVQMLSKSGDCRRIEWVGAATDEGRVYAVGRDVSALSQAVEKLAIQNDELQRLHDLARAEERLAGQLLANVRRQGCLDAPGIRYVASPLGFFNGDVALAALTPSGELRWMLGDFTGHGLSAAIGTIPVAGAFYAACRQDAPLTDAIASINDLLKSLLPAGLFCAAGFLSLSRNSDVLSVWNSALPPILLRRAGAGQVHEYASQSLPLGLVTSRELAIQPLQVPVSPGDEVLIFSDGVSEAANVLDELLGVERVVEALRSAAASGSGFDAVVGALASFRGTVQANDDVSLVSVSVGETRTLTVGMSARNT
jgi:PAS domain S-box-containing protein